MKLYDIVDMWTLLRLQLCYIVVLMHHNYLFIFCSSTTIRLYARFFQDKLSTDLCHVTVRQIVVVCHQLYCYYDKYYYYYYCGRGRHVVFTIFHFLVYLGWLTLSAFSLVSDSLAPPILLHWAKLRCEQCMSVVYGASTGQ